MKEVPLPCRDFLLAQGRILQGKRDVVVNGAGAHQVEMLENHPDFLRDSRRSLSFNAIMSLPLTMTFPSVGRCRRLMVLTKLREDVQDRAVFDHAAVFHHSHFVADFLHDLHLMGDDDDRQVQSLVQFFQ